jgi:hypothetical protein
MMNNFTKLLYVKNNGKLEFYFARKFTGKGVRYFITVVDRSMKSYLFYMEEVETNWQILDPHKLPPWLTGMEYELANAIREQ